MKKKFLLLPIVGAFLLSGCKFTIFGKTIAFFEKDKSSDNQQKQEDIDDVKPEEMAKHANKLTQSPNAPFFLKVDEEKTVSVTLDPTPTKDEEKVFTWSLKGDAITYTVEENTAKADIKGVKPGTAELTATNTYNKELKRTFYIEVIDFDEEKDYLWQYKSDDKGQFGYTSENKAGVASGDAVLNGMTWSFVREPNAISLNLTQSGYIGFGKGKEPETHLHFEAENGRVANKISIEAASANSLAKITVKVGDTVYLNEATVAKVDAESISPLVSNVETPVSGKIVIDVYTPEYDKTEDETNYSYLAPGAFYLKSILINFNEKLPDKTMTLVKNVDQILDGSKYLIVGHSDAGYTCLNGAATSSTNIKDAYLLEEFSLTDTVDVSANFDQYAFTASIDENSKLNFTNSAGNKVGLSNGGDLSCTANPNILGWDYTLNSSYQLDMTMYDNKETPRLRHFGANSSTGKFSAYANATDNVYLYKF